MVSFVDEVTLYLRAGHGGNGCVSVRREKFKPLAGPDGGNGGNGGDIVLLCDSQTTTLLEFYARPHRISANGQPGAGDNKSGMAGAPIELRVPVGTVVHSEDGAILIDLTVPGQRFVAAAGGVGGLGNAALASTKRKAPGFALLGTLGTEVTLRLEQKTIADVALVGFPSAGKSSLISAMSAARPKIADYPFTTLHPHLGVVQAGEYRYTIADVPGLIEGASEGRGLGLDFLRHVERCYALVHVIDCATLDPHRDPAGDLDTVLTELRAYQVPAEQLPLVERPQLVVLNKVDVPDAAALAEFIQPELEVRGYRVFQISAVSHQGLREFGFALGEIIAAYRTQAAQTAQTENVQIIIHSTAVNKNGFKIKVEGTIAEPIYRVLGVKPERWVQQTDFSNDEAIGFLADRLARIGVEDELVRAGAIPGSTVVIGPGAGVIFDWEPTLTSTAELLSAPRGMDLRINQHNRLTRSERRANYYERMDAKAEARAELERERVGGSWSDELVSTPDGE